MSVKQVIVVRTRYPDGKGGFFKPRTGKLIAQGAHASMKVFFDRARISDNLGMLIPLTNEMRLWATGQFAKVCVRAESEAQLLDLHKQAMLASLPCAIIQDSGKTEFHGVLTYTALAIGPAKAEDIDPITGGLALL